jgi:HK97 gp10 family phage protein
MQAGGGISGTFKLKGADKLLAALKDLEPKLAKGVLSKAMRAGAKPILETAKAMAPVDTGDLRRSLKIRAIKRNRKGRVGVVISTDKGFFKGDTFYAAFHEFGTSRMPARPFIRPAFDAHKVSSVKIIGNEIWSGIRAVTTGAARDSLQGALAE